MRPLFVVLFAPWLAPCLAHADNTTPPPNPPITTLVGQLTLQHTHQCKDRVDEWVDPHHEIGFVRVISDVPLTALEGKLVVAEGVVSEVPVPPVARDGSCPPAQMRSDMVMSKGGIRRMRSGALPFRGFRITRVRPLTGLTASRSADDVEVRFTNELSRPLPIKLTVHYEGCYGKPDTAQRIHSASVEPGKSLRARFPARVDQGAQPDRAIHAASTVQVTTPEAGIAMVIDQPLDGPSACPRR
jgi:hypothetical protein